LERTVIRRRVRAASAPFRYALAARWTAQRAAAQLRRHALLMRGALVVMLAVAGEAQAFEPGPCKGTPAERHKALTDLVDPVLSFQRDLGKAPEYLEQLVPKYVVSIAPGSWRLFGQLPSDREVVYRYL
jgi:hypothetical protein